MIWYLFTITDRLFIAKYLGEYELGLFSIGSKVALLLMLATGVFRLAWLPIAMENLNKPEGKNMLRTLSRYYIGLMSIGAVLLTFLSKFILETVTAKAYAGGFIVVGPLTIQAILSSYNLIIGIGITKTERTYFYPVCLFFSTIINIVLNYILIPKFGILGAAVSSAAAFSLWNLSLILISEHLWRVNFPLKRIGLIFVITCISVAYITYLHYNNIFPYLSILFLFLIITLLLSLTINQREFLHFKKMIFKND